MQRKVLTETNISQRVSALRRKLGITQQELADRMNYVRNYISLVENGQMPSNKFIRELDRLEQGTAPDIEHEARLTASTIPLLSWAEAGTTEAWKQVQDHKGITCFNVGDDKAVAVEIRGDSMEPQFPQGTIAIVYPSSKAKSGDLVIACLKDGTVMFKRLHVDGDSHTFISLNPIYPPVTVEKTKVERVLPVGMTFQNHL